MKKVILSALVLTGLASNVNAQSLWVENFNAAPAGNAAPVTDGTDIGVGGAYYLNGALGDFQITPMGAPYENSLYVITGTGSASTDHRYVIKEVTTAPTANNTYLKGSMDFFTGFGGGLGRGMMQVFSGDANNAAICGIGYDSQTKTFIGSGKFILTANPTTQQNTLFALTDSTNPIADGIWVKLGFVYNRTTGQISWSIPTGNLSLSNTNTYTPIPGAAVEEIYLIASANPNNFGPNDYAFDNINVEYSDTATLNLDEIPVKATGVKVYPNPTTDVLKITAKSKVDAVEIFDISGKKIDAVVKNNEIDVRSYTPGTYIINVITKDGKTMTKFIKN